MKHCFTIVRTSIEDATLRTMLKATLPGVAMCRKSQILDSVDVVTKIPDELAVTPHEVEAIAIVLRLLSRMLVDATAP